MTVDPQVRSASLLDDASQRALRHYVDLLREPDPTVATLIAAGLATDQASRAVAGLTALGWATVEPSGRIALTPPREALPRHAQELEMTAQMLRSVTRELSQIYYSTQMAATEAPGISFIGSLDAALAAVEACGAEAAHSILITLRDDDLGFAVLDGSMLAHGASGLNPHVAVRCVYDLALLDHPGTADRVAERATAGEAQRIGREPACGSVFVDHVSGIVDWATGNEPGPRGAILRQPAVTRAFGSAAEGYWSLATPMPAGLGAGAQPLDDRDRTILQLMAAGAADTRIARMLNISQRTVERRVRSLMRQLDAESRFQAGVLAVARGLVDLPR